MEAGQFVGEPGFTGSFGDAIELGPDGGDALRLDTLFIHAGGVGIADELLIGGASGFIDCGFFENGLQGFAIAELEFIEAAPAGLIGRNGIALHPGAAGVLIKIVAGIGRAVDCAEVKAGSLGRRRK